MFVRKKIVLLMQDSTSIPPYNYKRHGIINYIIFYNKNNSGKKERIAMRSSIF